MRPCANFWIEKDGKVVLSEWRVALLEAVEQTGSINAAAAQQGVPFRVAWRKIQEEVAQRFRMTPSDSYVRRSATSIPIRNA
jgi:molybdenum-dependent DNA-binding transcriptional regulator ModE